MRRLYRVISPLDAARTKKFVLHDIRWENDMTPCDYIVKVVDFGPAQLAADPAATEWYPVDAETMTGVWRWLASSRGGG